MSSYPYAAPRQTVVDLAYRPREWQRQCHLRRKRFTVLALHRRAGKTELALRELLDEALRNTLDLPLYFYVAPLLKQAKAIAWARLKQIVEPLVLRGLAEVHESELWVRLKANGAIIRCYGADNPDAMRGVRLDGVVVDEVAQIDPTVWDDVLQPALSDRMGWALFIGTPKGVNLFSKLFYDNRADPDWHCALYTVYDTDALNPIEVERLRRTMSPTSFAREFLCDFSAAGEDQLLSLMDVELAAQRHLRREEYSWAPMVLGVDPARFGDDRSVIFPRQGAFAHEPRIFHKIDNMTLAGHVIQAIHDYHADAVFIDEGNGGGVIDRVRQLGYECIGIPFGGHSPKPRFSNMRTFMWFEMAEWTTAGGVIPNLQELKQDMAAPTYKFMAGSDKIALESKDDIKERIKVSPDLGDALALTFARPVLKDHSIYAAARAAGLPVHQPSAIDHDPYANVSTSNFAGHDPYA